MAPQFSSSRRRFDRYCSFRNKFSFKYVASQQLGLFAGHIDKLLSFSIWELKDRYAFTQIDRKDVQSVSILFNKFLAHRMEIVTSRAKYSLSIEDRNKAKEYQCLVDVWKHREREII